VRFSIVDLDGRNGPFLTQQPHCSTSKGAMQAGCSLAFCVEDIGDLSIHEPSLVQFTDSAISRLHIGGLFIAAHAAFVTELLMGSGLPVDLNPDLSVGSLTIDDHVPDHQA
jgi:hypothetical protein